MEASTVNEPESEEEGPPAPGTIISLTPVDGWRITFKGERTSSSPVIALALVFREPGERPEVHPVAVITGRPNLIMGDDYQLHHLTS